MTQRGINEVLKAFDIEALPEYKEPGEVNQRMRFGLAQIYTDEGVRAYLLNAINVATRNAANASDNEITGSFFKGRMVTLRELYAKAEQAFKELEKIKDIELKKKNAIPK